MAIAEAKATSNVDELWSIFREGLHEGIQLYIPHKTTKSRDSLPWIERNRAYKASKRHGRLEDEINFQTLKKAVQKDLRRAY